MFYFGILFLMCLIVHVNGQLDSMCSDRESSVALSVSAAKQSIQDATCCSGLYFFGYCINHSEILVKECQDTLFDVSRNMTKFNIGHTKIKFCTNIEDILNFLNVLYAPASDESGILSPVKDMLVYCNVPFISMMTWPAIKNVLATSVSDSSDIGEAQVKQHASLKVTTGLLFWLYVAHKEGELKMPYGKFLEALLPGFCTSSTDTGTTDIYCDGFAEEFMEVLLPKIIPLLTEIIKKGPQSDKTSLMDLLAVFDFFLENNSFDITPQTVMKKMLKPACDMDETKAIYALISFVDDDLECSYMVETAQSSDCYRPLDQIDASAEDNFPAVQTHVLDYMDQIKTCEDFVKVLGCYSPEIEVFLYRCQHTWYSQCSHKSYPSYKDSLATFTIKSIYRYLALNTHQECCKLPVPVPPAEPSTTTTTVIAEGDGTPVDEDGFSIDDDSFTGEEPSTGDGMVPESHTSSAFDLRILPTVLILFIVFMVTLY